jgi:hypothetical protein
MYTSLLSPGPETLEILIYGELLPRLARLDAIGIVHNDDNWTPS